MSVLPEIESMTEQLVRLFHPEKLILFGSQAKGTATPKSDIDICIVIEADADARKRREFITEISMALEVDKPFDLLLYTPKEWQACLNDPGSFAAQIINRQGIVLYDRQQAVSRLV